MVVKPILGLIAAVGVVLASSATLGRGCRDVQTSFTDLAYPPVRDMRQTVAIDPQKVAHPLPDSMAVPVTGREIPLTFDRRDAMIPRIIDPTGGADSGSVARGAARYRTFCTPCHGGAMAGDGPVAQSFMPPPDLLGPLTRGRSDGFIYAYIRDGGAVMPKYGQALSPAETWDVIHYLRQMQRTSPR
jgi:mono/diheme cytochrome c family protein